MTSHVCPHPQSSTDSSPLGTNRMAFKCKAQRNYYIRREVGGLIRKELKTFFARKKIQKEVENNGKDFITLEVPSPLERVHSFRIKEKENDVNKLEKFLGRSKQVDQRVKSIMERKMEQSIAKSRQNFRQMLKVRRNYQNIQDKDYQKVQTLKNSFLQSSARTPRAISSLSRVSVRDHGNRNSTAQQISRAKQQRTINSFLHKMKDMEQRNIKKEMAAETMKSQMIKTAPKCYISKRIQHEEQLVKKWEQIGEDKINRFQKSRENLFMQRSQQTFERSMDKNELCEKNWERKYTKEELQAAQRMESIQNKLQKIDKIVQGKRERLNRSELSQRHNETNMVVESHKQSHNDKMRRIYNIIKKLKDMDDMHQLSKEEVAALEENLSPSDPDFQEILDYLNMSKNKFFEKKQKDEEERAKKKSKKAAGKIL